jgi:hypothetical protein
LHYGSIFTAATVCFVLSSQEPEHGLKPEYGVKPVSSKVAVMREQIVVSCCSAWCMTPEFQLLNHQASVQQSSKCRSCDVHHVEAGCFPAHLQPKWFYDAHEQFLTFESFLSNHCTFRAYSGATIVNLVLVAVVVLLVVAAGALAAAAAAAFDVAWHRMPTVRVP